MTEALGIALAQVDGTLITIHRQKPDGAESQAACGARSENFIRYAPLMDRDEALCGRCFPTGTWELR